MQNTITAQTKHRILVHTDGDEEMGMIIEDHLGFFCPFLRDTEGWSPLPPRTTLFLAQTDLMRAFANERHESLALVPV